MLEILTDSFDPSQPDPMYSLHLSMKPQNNNNNRMFSNFNYGYSGRYFGGKLI